MKKMLGVPICLYFLLNLLCSHSSFLLNRSINNQVNFIDTELKAGADANLQEKYPEGYLFSNCLLSLSLIELEDLDSIKQRKYASIVDRCLNRILSEKAKENFDELLPLANGAFYNGWANYSLKKYVGSELFRFSSDQKHFETAYDSISSSIINLQRDSLQILESYTSSMWPADNIVCISSLPEDQSIIKNLWLNKLDNNSESKLDLINHDNFNRGIVRGSSQALMLYFLKETSPKTSIKPNQKFKELFHQRIMGMSLVKEFHKEGEQDVDSGPIVFGFGSVATIMNIKTQSRFNVKERATWNFLNLLGVSINIGNKKYYLLKKELMFDIFMLWTSVSLI